MVKNQCKKNTIDFTLIDSVVNFDHYQEISVYYENIKERNSNRLDIFERNVMSDKFYKV